MYFPYFQLVDKYLPLGIEGGATVVVRTRSDPLGFITAMQDQTAQLDDGLAMFDVRTLDNIVFSWLATRRLAMILLSLFAALALVLAAIGIYGVISYIVGQRSHEIGVRISLGAQPQDVFRLILAQGGKLTLLGIVLGAVLAVLLGRRMGWHALRRRHHRSVHPHGRYVSTPARCARRLLHPGPPGNARRSSSNNRF
jgi:putative ABC transport system permease protein